MNSLPRQDETLTALTVTNVILGLLIVVAAVGFGYLQFYQPQAEPEDFRPYVAEVRQRLTEHSPEIQAEATALAAEIGPPMVKALEEQAREDADRYVRVLRHEGRKYVESMEKQLAAKVRAKVEDYLRRHRTVLVEEFPDHASEENVERVMKEFEETIGKLSERYYLEDFRRQADRTAQVWNQIEPLDPPPPGGPSLEEQLADYVADWAVLTAVPPSPDGEQPRESQPTPPPAADAPRDR